MPFRDLDDIRSACRALPAGDAQAAAAAAARQATLTKPAGSLGRLEELAIWLARWQGKAIPLLERVQILVFAGNHGVTRRGVSAYPAAVTAQMIGNFEAGGAAINQLARLAGADLKVVVLDIDRPTADFTVEPAMSSEEFLTAFESGFLAVSKDANLVALGEMGIGNTTAAATLCAALCGGGGVRWVGRGTGVDDTGLRRKHDAVNAAINRHRALLNDPLAVAAALGGRELAALSGAALAARLLSIPVVLDGYVATAAMLPLARINAAILDHCCAGHVSAEAAHADLLRELRITPLLDLDMRLGEGSGAALAILLLRAAVACHAGMATFAGAGVSEKSKT